MGCGGNCDRILRHNSLRDAVFSAAQSAALAPRREVPSLIPGNYGSPKKGHSILPTFHSSILRMEPELSRLLVISTKDSQYLSGGEMLLPSPQSTTCPLPGWCYLILFGLCCFVLGFFLFLFSPSFVFLMFLYVFWVFFFFLVVDLDVYMYPLLGRCYVYFSTATHPRG